jgi:steroid delta-isomerase-like uncharacterized protein
MKFEGCPLPASSRDKDDGSGMKDLPDRLLEAYNRHDPSAVARLYGAHATHEDIAQGRLRRGPDAIADGLRRFFQWFPDARWEPALKIAGQQNRSAITYRLIATLQEPMGSVAARGQQISLRGVLVLEQNDDLISRSTDFWDGLTFQRQLNNTHDGGKK